MGPQIVGVFFLSFLHLQLALGEYLVSVEFKNYTTTDSRCEQNGCSPYFRLCQGDSANLTCSSSRVFNKTSSIFFGMEGAALFAPVHLTTLPSQYTVDVEVLDSVQHTSTHHFNALQFPETNLHRGAVIPVILEDGTYRLVLDLLVECRVPYVGPQCQCKPQDNVLCNIQTGQQTCAAGFSGHNCQHADTVLASCEQHQRCENGGTCQTSEGGHSFSCLCTAGYSGTHCQINADDCSSAPCLNGGSCVDGVNGFTCVCAPDYFGSRCEMTLSDTFLVPPCHNGGYRLAGAENCTCPGNYTGAYCQNDVDECSEDTHHCQNGGHCINMHPGYHCECTAGFSGVHCEVDKTDLCAGHTCMNGGTCHYIIGMAYCMCTTGYKGENCEIDSNECASSPCQNGGSCVDIANGFHCTCTSGYTGGNCQTRDGLPIVG